MSEEKKARFDAKFLQAVAVRLILEPHFVVKFKKYLKAPYFKHADDGGFLENIMKIWFDRVWGNATDPSFDSLYAWLQMQPDGEQREKTIATLEKLRWDKELVTMARSEHHFEVFLQWLKATAFLSEYREVKDAFNSGNYDLAYQSLEQTLGNIKSIALDSVESADWQTAETFLTAESLKLVNKFEFGIEDFDQAGGFEEQSLNLFVAMTNGGKTMLSVHLMAECVKQGKVGYFAFVEDRKTTILRRLYSNLTGIPINELKNFASLPPDQKALVNVATERLKKYLVVEFIYGVSPDFIFERAKEVMAQRRAAMLPQIEVMCVDYLQHIAQFSPGEKSYEKLANSMARYKDFVLKYKLTGFTHQQINRSGAIEQNKDNLITLGELSTSFNAAFVCDSILSLNRSPEQKEREEAVFYVLKGREGAAERRYQVKTNFACAQYLMNDYCRLDAMKS